MKKLLVLITLVVLIGSNFCGHSLMKAMAEERDDTAMSKYYTSIQIQKGDSLWSIADKYADGSGMTKSEYIQELKNMNSLREDTIHSGQFLTVVYFSDHQ